MRCMRKLTEVDNDQLKGEPAAVDNVESVLRHQLLKTDRVDVLVEDEGCLNEEALDHQTLGTNPVWKDFDGVGDQETVPCQRVRCAVEEDEGDNCLSGSSVAAGLVQCGADGPDDEADQHT